MKKNNMKKIYESKTIWWNAIMFFALILPGMQELYPEYIKGIATLTIIVNALLRFKTDTKIVQ